MPSSTEDPGLTPREELVAAIVGFGGPLASIVVHMVHNGASEESLGDVLSGLRTNIEIDDEVMRAAQRLTGGRTKRETVDLALRELVARQRRLGIL